MATLYEIAPQHRELADRLRAMGLDDDVIEDTLEAESDLPGKVETYCIVIREREADLDALKKERDRLIERIRSEESAIKRMKDALLYGLQSAGETKVKAGTFLVSLRKTAGSVEVLDEKAIPRDYYTDPEPQISKSLILQALRDGHEVPGAVLKKSETVAIK